MLALTFVVLTGALRSEAAEPRPVAGWIEPNQFSGLFSDAFLKDAVTGHIAAGLLDPRGLLPGQADAAILQAEFTGRVEINGLPLLEVRDVAPEFWAQPSIYHHFVKGPGAWSGFGREYHSKDFAGTPLNSLRAYQHDNGLPTRTIRGGSLTSAPPPLRVREVRASGQDLALQWEASPFLRYRLLAGATLDGAYQVVEEFTAPAEGLLEIVVPRTAEQAFYILQAVQP